MRSIVKIIMFVVMSVMYVITRKPRYKFLAKYISRGWEGRDIDINPSLVSCFGMNFWANRFARENYAEIDFGPIHSTDYDKEGFYGRPELFYLVGGFGYTVECTDEHVIIRAEDKYDWHHMNSGSSEHDPTWYFASPLPFPLSWEKYGTLMMVLNSIIGCAAFVESFEGTVGISNCLWDWMHGFSDRGVFTSKMEWKFNGEEFGKMYDMFLNDMHERDNYDDDDYDEYNYNEEDQND